MKLLSLILSLPTKTATVRQRVWRSLKTSGAASLRDGVYLLPDRKDCHVRLETLVADVRKNGGQAHLLRVDEPEGEHLASLFDRSAEYAALLAELERTRVALSANTVDATFKQVRKLRRTFDNLVVIDFFPGEGQRQLGASLNELELVCAQLQSPDEPHAEIGVITKHCQSDYQQRTWATRQRPWVDRLACAWLIRRFIDPEAKILWLERPQDCPTEALGFDFDGATFSHIGNRVTFEVLIASFGLEQPALTRLGLLVHYLDVGGVQPPEAVGVEAVLAGLREFLHDDDQLLTAASNLFDGLLTSFSKQLDRGASNE